MSPPLTPAFMTAFTRYHESAEPTPRRESLRERYGHLFDEPIWRCKRCQRIGIADRDGTAFRTHLLMYHWLPR